MNFQTGGYGKGIDPNVPVTAATPSKPFARNVCRNALEMVVPSRRL